MPIVSMVIFLLTVVLVLAASEGGYALGRRFQKTSNEEERSQIVMIEAALLGLLALLLGFTFAMAVNRFDMRQEFAVREANAMGTAYLRSDFLPPEASAAFKAKLGLYADARIEFFDSGADASRIQEALRRTSRLQAELWVFARDEARARPTPPAGLFAMALNDLFDLSESRTAGLEIRVPITVWIALYVVAALACGSLGFGSGLMNRRLMLPIILLPLLMSLILTLLLDLDHPRRGLIRTSQESLLRFSDSLR